MADSKLEWALKHVADGFRVLPLHWIENERCSCRNPECDSLGKHPLFKGWQADATRDEALIRAWWSNNPNANVGGIVGEPDGFSALDVDPRNGGDDSYKALIAKYGKLPDGPISRTGSGGNHRLFQTPSVPTRSTGIEGFPGLDWKGKGKNGPGFIVLPGSDHISGGVYEWEVGSEPGEVDVPEVPDWLLDLVKVGTRTCAADGNEDIALSPILEGGRNSALTSLAGKMRRGGMTADELFPALQSLNRSRCKPPLEDDEVWKIVRSVASYPPGSDNSRFLASDISPSEKATFQLTRLEDLLQEPLEEVSWVVEDTLGTGGLSMVAAKPKVGKSTLARNLALSVSREEPFFGRSTQGGLVLYFGLEEKRGEVTRHFERMGASKENLLIHVGAPPENAFEEFARVVREHRPVLAIVDPLFHLAKIRDANDYAAVVSALRPFMDLARETGTHILVTHHMGKAERGDGDGVLGSTALFGAVDTLIELRKRSAGRVLSSTQRYGEDLPETVAALDLETGIVSPLGDLATFQLNEAKEAIRAILGAPMTEPEIREETKRDRALTAKALREMVEAREVVRNGNGRKGDPYLYSLDEMEEIAV